jgi:hypothetical protein
VLNSPPDPEFKSAERLAFEIYLRTGRRIVRPDVPERKFNPYHDPRNGQFTFAPGGARSVGGPRVSGGLRKRTEALALEGPAKPVDAASGVVAGERNPARSTAVDARAAAQVLNNSRPNPRARMGGNGGPPISDPLTIMQAVPALQNAPVASVVAIPAEFFLDLTGPAREATATAHAAYVRTLIAQIRTLNPNYQHRAAGPPVQSFLGQITEINKLRWDRAVALYSLRGDIEALKVELTRVMQHRANSAYDEAVELLEKGELRPLLSPREAIGNYVDRAVKRELEERLKFAKIDYSAGQPVRIQGREYITSGNDRTYKKPDARVGRAALDVTIREKSLKDKQVVGFFDGDFEPDIVIIIRPRQVGGSYIITRPR